MKVAIRFRGRGPVERLLDRFGLLDDGRVMLPQPSTQREAILVDSATTLLSAARLLDTIASAGVEVTRLQPAQIELLAELSPLRASFAATSCRSFAHSALRRLSRITP